ncbi:hypothetical protein HOH87_00155 [bacterium]|jgi:hypothetical protein|nr:hypothetical protein [bacterium]
MANLEPFAQLKRYVEMSFDEGVERVLTNMSEQFNTVQKQMTRALLDTVIPELKDAVSMAQRQTDLPGAEAKIELKRKRAILVIRQSLKKIDERLTSVVDELDKVFGNGLKYKEGLLDLAVAKQKDYHDKLMGMVKDAEAKLELNPVLKGLLGEIQLLLDACQKKVQDRKEKIDGEFRALETKKEAMKTELKEKVAQLKNDINSKIEGVERDSARWVATLGELDTLIESYITGDNAKLDTQAAAIETANQLMGHLADMGTEILSAKQTMFEKLDEMGVFSEGVIDTDVGDLKALLIAHQEALLAEMNGIKESLKTQVKDAAGNLIGDAQSVFESVLNPVSGILAKGMDIVPDGVKDLFFKTLGRALRDDSWRVRERVLMSLYQLQSGEGITPAVKTAMGRQLVHRKTNETRKEVKLLMKQSSFATALTDAVRKNWASEKEQVKLEIQTKIASVEDLYTRIHEEKDPEKRQQMIDVSNAVQAELDEQLSNLSGMEQMGVAIGFLKGLKKQLFRMEQTLDQLKELSTETNENVKKVVDKLGVTAKDYKGKIAQLHTWMDSDKDKQLSKCLDGDDRKMIANQKTLAQMKLELSRGRNGIVLEGIAGAGKSTTAARYIDQESAAYDRIYWLDMESEESLKESLKRYQVYESGVSLVDIVSELLTPPSNQDEFHQIVVLNNVDDPTPEASHQTSVINKLIKIIHFDPHGVYRGDYIITTRMSENATNTIKITGFDLAQCHRYFEKIFGVPEYSRKKELDVLFGELINQGRGQRILPLTLKHVMTLLEPSNASMASIRNLAEDIKQNRLDPRRDIFVENISQLQTKRNGKECFDLLKICAFMPIDSITVDRLVYYAETNGISRHRLMELLEGLASSSLLEIVGDQYRMHREIQEVIQERFLQNTDDYIEVAIEALQNRVLYDVYRSESRIAVDVKLYVESQTLSGRNIRDLSYKFLDDPTKDMMLITADSGYGKTTKMHAVRKEILKHNAKTLGRTNALPIWLELSKLSAYLGKEDATIIDDELKRFGFKEKHIQELKRRYKVVVFVDEYDEARVPGKENTKELVPYLGNVYYDLNLSEWTRLKVFLAIRTQHLSYFQDTHSRQPRLRSSQGNHNDEMKTCFSEIKGVDDDITSRALFDRLRAYELPWAEEESPEIMSEAESTSSSETEEEKVQRSLKRIYGQIQGLTKKIVKKRCLITESGELDSELKNDPVSAIQEIQKALGDAADVVDAKYIYQILSHQGLRDPEMRGVLTHRLHKHRNPLKQDPLLGFQHAHLQGLEEKQIDQYIRNYVYFNSDFRGFSEKEVEAKVDEIKKLLANVKHVLDSPLILRIALEYQGVLRQKMRTQGDLVAEDLYEISSDQYFDRQIAKFIGDNTLNGDERLRDNFGTSDRAAIKRKYTLYAIELACQMGEGYILRQSDRQSSKYNFFHESENNLRQGIPIKYDGNEIQFIHEKCQSYYRMFATQVDRVNEYCKESFNVENVVTNSIWEGDNATPVITQWPEEMDQTNLVYQVVGNKIIVGWKNGDMAVMDYDKGTVRLGEKSRLFKKGTSHKFIVEVALNNGVGHYLNTKNELVALEQNWVFSKSPFDQLLTDPELIDGEFPLESQNLLGIKEWNSTMGRLPRGTCFEVPVIAKDIRQSLKDMIEKGEAPVLILDPGYSIFGLKQVIEKKHGNSNQFGGGYSNGPHGSVEWKEDRFATETTDPKWMVVSTKTSDKLTDGATSVFRDLWHLAECQNYQVMTAREAILAAIFYESCNNKPLFPKGELVRCADLNVNGVRIILGNFSGEGFGFKHIFSDSIDFESIVPEFNNERAYSFDGSDSSESDESSVSSTSSLPPGGVIVRNVTEEHSDKYDDDDESEEGFDFDSHIGLRSAEDDAAARVWFASDIVRDARARLNRSTEAYEQAKESLEKASPMSMAPMTQVKMDCKSELDSSNNKAIASAEVARNLLIQTYGDSYGYVIPGRPGKVPNGVMGRIGLPARRRLTPHEISEGRINDAIFKMEWSNSSND